MPVRRSAHQTPSDTTRPYQALPAPIRPYQTLPDPTSPYQTPTDLPHPPFQSLLDRRDHQTLPDAPSGACHTLAFQMQSSSGAWHAGGASGADDDDEGRARRGTAPKSQHPNIRHETPSTQPQRCLETSGSALETRRQRHGSALAVPRDCPESAQSRFKQATTKPQQTPPTSPNSPHPNP